MGYPLPLKKKKDMEPVKLLWDGDGVPPLNKKDMEPVKLLWDGDGVAPSLWTDRLMPAKTLPSRRIPCAGCKKWNSVTPRKWEFRK